MLTLTPAKNNPRLVIAKEHENEKTNEQTTNKEKILGS